MRHKRDIKIQQIKLYKACLNVDSSRMRKGIHYNEIYLPVANWSSVRLITTLDIALNWNTVQIDYVQAYPQALVEKPLYLKIPVGFKMSKGKAKDYILYVNNNIYG